VVSLIEDVIKEKCGIAAVSLPEKGNSQTGEELVSTLHKMLLRQQHRGQLSAGITTYNGKRKQILDTYKELGSVSKIFRLHNPAKNKSIASKYSGTKGIGHVRYATSGSTSKYDVQPFERHHGRRWKWFGFGFNGTIANFSELKKELHDASYHLVRNCDTEVLMHHISKELVGDKKKGLDEVFQNLSGILDGSYSLAYINADNSVAIVRDPLGIKPLCYIEKDGVFAGASESCALTAFSENGITNVKPGEMVIAENGSVEVKRFAKSKRSAHCMFEWVYFANPASTMEGRNVYEVRWNLGRELAKQEKLETNRKDYIVVAVPDTSRPAADAYANELGLISMEGLLRNRYIGRTFIEGGNRYEMAREKYSINKSIVKGKKIILVDDSIVRGTTSKALIDYIRKVGKPKEIHFRVSGPPIRFPCFYGIDMSTLSELIAPNCSSESERFETGMTDISEKAIEGIRKDIGVDSLQYQSLEGLVRAIGLEGGEKSMCMACLTGEYPTECGKSLFKKAINKMGKDSKKRTYD
jgi:amidophosphoribosyltransferase